MNLTPHLKKLLQVTIFAFPLLIGFLSYWFSQSTDNLLSTYSTGRLLGKAALGLLGLTLLPGICKRLGYFTFITKYLMPIRRHLGILMFLSVLAHWWFIFTLPNLVLNNFPPKIIPPTVITGLLAAATYLPLFLTSNDFSVRLLKRKWALIHKLTYLGLLLVGLHLLIQSSLLSLVTAFLIVAEILSFIVVTRRQSATKPVPPTQT